MPFADKDKKRKYMDEYNKQYYLENKDKLLKYRKQRRHKNNEAWKRWSIKKKDAIRKEKINLGQIYKPKSPYS